MVGAYISGTVLDASWFEEERLNSFRKTILLAVMPVFFLSTGLKTRWQIHGSSLLGVTLLLLFVSVAGKLAGTGIAGRILGWPRGQSHLIGWLLQTKALIMIIFSDVLLSRKIITDQTFTALLLMAAASTMLTMPVVTRLRLKRCIESPSHTINVAG
jgi:Kef-type K+ transport system membrane component KefB